MFAIRNAIVSIALLVPVAAAAQTPALLIEPAEPRPDGTVFAVLNSPAATPDLKYEWTVVKDSATLTTPKDFSSNQGWLRIPTLKAGTYACFVTVVDKDNKAQKYGATFTVRQPDSAQSPAVPETADSVRMAIPSAQHHDYGRMLAADHWKVVSVAQLLARDMSSDPKTSQNFSLALVDAAASAIQQKRSVPQIVSALPTIPGSQVDSQLKKELTDLIKTHALNFENDKVTEAPEIAAIVLVKLAVELQQELERQVVQSLRDRTASGDTVTPPTMLVPTYRCCTK